MLQTVRRLRPFPKPLDRGCTIIPARCLLPASANNQESLPVAPCSSAWSKTFRRLLDCRGLHRMNREAVGPPAAPRSPPATSGRSITSEPDSPTPRFDTLLSDFCHPLRTERPKRELCAGCRLVRKGRGSPAPSPHRPDRLGHPWCFFSPQSIPTKRGKKPGSSIAGGPSSFRSEKSRPPCRDDSQALYWRSMATLGPLWSADSNFSTGSPCRPDPSGYSVHRRCSKHRGSLDTSRRIGQPELDEVGVRKPPARADAPSDPGRGPEDRRSLAERGTLRTV